MHVLEAIQSRRTVKKFDNRPVAREDLETALTAACWAPSHRNSQPWLFRVLQSSAKQRLAQIYYERILNHSHMPEEKKSKKLPFAKDFGGSSAVIIVLCRIGVDEREQQENLEAIGASVQNLHLALHSCGLATAWLTPKMLLRDMNVKELAQLPPDYMIVGFLPVGYPTQPPPPKERVGIVGKVVWID